MYNQNAYDQNSQAWQQPTMDAASAGMAGVNVEDPEDGDNSHRPPNAFILYSQAMRSEARQQNPSLSNTESFNDEGNVIYFNEEHPLKALLPILVTEDEISILINDEHM